MASCINKSSIEYQTLKNKSGISTDILDPFCSKFIEEHDRWPHLDELPRCDSSKELKKALKLKRNNGTTVKNILDYTKKPDIESSNAFINDIYSDLEVELIPIQDDCLVNITPRPNDYEFIGDQIYIQDTTKGAPLLIMKTLDKLAKLYGIKFNQVTDAELASDKWSNLVASDKIVNGFVYNGEIYINTDRASVDTPVHEMLHLLLGSMRFTNPKLYQTIVSQAESFKNYDYLAKDYLNRTKNDINEELFISEFAKYVTGQNSELSNLDKKVLYEINYTVHRTLDSMLMGSLSSKTLSDDLLYNLSLKLVAKWVNSDVFTDKFRGTYNEKGSMINRQLNNMKSKLMQKGLLEEIC